MPYDGSNATVRCRALHWLDRYASKRGIDARSVARLVGPGFESTVRSGSGPTLLLRNRHRFSRGRAEERILRSATPGIYDLDDGLPWDDGTLPDLGRWWKRPWPRALIAERAARAADRMIVGNAVLADWASERCDDVRLIPTCVEPDDYRVKELYEVRGPPLIGWIGSRATETYLAEVAPALAELHRRCGLRLEIVSAPGPIPPDLAAFSERVPWSPEVSATRLASWDAGIMPLRDGVYERAKCGYKLLQYAAAGVPAVGSPVGVNDSLLSDMRGLAPVTASEWVDALGQLLGESSDERQGRGAAGRRVAAAYSYDTWESRWRDAVGLE